LYQSFFDYHLNWLCIAGGIGAKKYGRFFRLLRQLLYAFVSPYSATLPYNATKLLDETMAK
jgi:hypothetical protein